MPYNRMAVLTGDIIASAKIDPDQWLPILKKGLGRMGVAGADWEVYRGDEFQLRASAEQALEHAIYLKALIRTVKGLDVRLAIGLGEETHTAATVRESNGSAYQFSGRLLERLKESGCNMAIASSHQSFDNTLNLMLRLALDFMDGWSSVSAEVVALNLENPEVTQEVLAGQLEIKQSAVSQRLKRARMDLVTQLIAYYRTTLNDIF